MKNDVVDLDALEEICNGASAGPWIEGPETGAGLVWVYRHGSPICEPLRYIAGLVRKLPIPMFKMRDDSYRQ